MVKICFYVQILDNFKRAVFGALPILNEIELLNL